MDVVARRAAATGLARFRNDEAVRSALSAVLLQDPDVAVRQSAAAALTKMGPKARLALAQAATCDPDGGVRGALAAFAKRSTVVCHTVAAPPDSPLPVGGGEEQLLAYLGHPSPATRLAAARELARLKSARGYTAVWAMASRDPVFSVRASAIRILARVYGRRLLPVLQHGLTLDPDARVRVVALEALGFLKAPETVSWIATSAKAETVPVVQIAAVTTLAKIGERTAVVALSDLATNHPSDEVRATALDSLAGLLGRQKASSPIFTRALTQDRSGAVRAVALRVLSDDNSPAACSARAARINDPDGRVRKVVVQQMARCAAKVARPALTAALREDRDAAVRVEAAALLVRAGVATSQQSLLHALKNDKDAEVRKLCLKAILTLPGKVVAGPVIEAVRNDPDAEVRRTAVAGMGKLPTSSAMPALATVLASDRATEVRLEAAKLLAKASDAAAYQALRLAAAKDASPEVKEAAAAGAAKSPAQKAWIDSLLPQVVDESAAVRLRAVNELCPLRVTRTYRALLLALWSDTDSGTRSAVAQCFGDLDHPLVDLGLSVAHSTDTDGGVIHAVEISQRQRVDRQAKRLERAKSAAPKERASAARLLQASPSNQVRDVLETLLGKDPDPGVRRAAATAVARYRDKRSLERLQRASQTDADPETRSFTTTLYNALRAHWAAGRAPLNINTLIQQLGSRVATSRVNAARSLGAMRDRRAFVPLKQARRSPDPLVRHAAVAGLAAFGDLAVVSQAAQGETDPAAKEKLIQLNYLSTAAPEKVVAALSSTKAEEVRRGVEAAAVRQLKEAVPWLVRVALAHGDKAVRAAAVRALVLFDLPLAQWAVRVASEYDASKKLRETLWQWAVFIDAGGS
jgi:HEAT repeat protein